MTPETLRTKVQFVDKAQKLLGDITITHQTITWLEDPVLNAFLLLSKSGTNHDIHLSVEEQKYIRDYLLDCRRQDLVRLEKEFASLEE